MIGVSQSQGHHQHGHSEHHHHGEEVEEDSLRLVWTGLTALSGVYIMFLIEHFLTLGKMYKDKKQKVRKASLKSPISCYSHVIHILLLAIL